MSDKFILVVTRWPKYFYNKYLKKQALATAHEGNRLVTAMVAGATYRFVPPERDRIQAYTPDVVYLDSQVTDPLLIQECDMRVLARRGKVYRYE